MVMVAEEIVVMAVEGITNNLAAAVTAVATALLAIITWVCVKKVSEQVDELRKDRERDSVVIAIAKIIDPIMRTLYMNGETISEIKSGNIDSLRYWGPSLKGDTGAEKDFIKRHKELVEDVAEYRKQVGEYNSNLGEVEKDIKEKVEGWIETSEELERYIPKFEAEFGMKDGKQWLKRDGVPKLTRSILGEKHSHIYIKDIFPRFEKELLEIRECEEIKSDIDTIRRMANEIEEFVQSTQLDTRLAERREKYMTQYNIWEDKLEAVKDDKVNFI